MDATSKLAHREVSHAAPALLLRARDLRQLMDPPAYVTAVESAFRCHANGGASVPAPMHVATAVGGFHVKSACMPLDHVYAAFKVNANFPGNPSRNGLPTIQGALLLFDGCDGRLLALMDSGEITLQRTAAASALAARYLARADSQSIAICGCGIQGRAHLVALARVVALKRAFAWDIDREKSRLFAKQTADKLRLDVIAVDDVRAATWQSDIVVTATSAREPFLAPHCIAPGTFIAAVGADSPAKNEAAPELFARSKVVVDSLAQCLAMGDLHHAVDGGAVTSWDVHAELGDLVVGRRPGRTSSDEITLFDSTGLAIEDVASAACAYTRALASGVGLPVVLG